MRHLAALVAVLLLLGAPGGLQAATLNFIFSFTNTGGDFVKGQILGVEDNATGAAQHVQVTSADFGIGEYVMPGARSPNSFTVTNGEVTEFAFLSNGVVNRAPVVTCCSLAFTNGFNVTAAALLNTPFGGGLPNSDDLTFSPLFGDPSPIPLPAPMLLLASALGGLGLLRRRAARAPGTAA